MRYVFTGPVALSAADAAVVRSAMYALPAPDAVTTGGAAGLDVMAAQLAMRAWPEALHEIVVPQAAYDTEAVEVLRKAGAVLVVAPWHNNSSDAYRARNELMLAPRDYDPAELHAFLRSPAFYRSGEWMTVNIAKRLGIPVVTVVLPSGHGDRANAMYEELRLLDRDQLAARYEEVTGRLAYGAKQAMIAEIIEKALAGEPL